MQAIGYCRFCGQGIGVVIGETATTDKINLAATMECGCDEARAFQATERKKTYAEANIRALLEEEPESIRQYCIGLIKPFAEETITKVKLTTRDGIVITMTAKEKSIKIERDEHIKAVKED